MKRFVKTIAALGLSLSLAMFPQNSLNAFADDVQSISSDCIRRLIPTNDDAEFPLSIYADIADDSIQYKELEEPLYNFTTALNTEVLDVDLIFSLKEEYQSFTNYELTICNDDYSTVLFSSESESCGDIIFRDFSVDQTYSFQVVLSNDSSKAEFVGQFYSAIELDSTFAMDLSYQLSLVEGDTSTFSAPVIEDEDELVNDDKVNSHYIPHGRTIKGDFSYSSQDVDWFNFITDYSSTGISKVDISVSVPANQKILLMLEKGEKTYCYYSQPGVGIHLGLELDPSTKYCFRLSPETAWANSDKYYVTVNIHSELAWYSQIKATIGVTDYWNDYKLDNLKITAEGKTKKVYDEGTNDGDWMETSCGVVCAAMIFRNKQKTMNGYDFRTNFTGELMADPFTAMLANCQLDGKKMSEGTTSLNVNCGYTPDSIWYYYIAEPFKATCTYLLDKEDKPSGWTIHELKELIKTHGMIMVRMPGTDNNHWMVFTGYTNGSDLAHSFYVYDPFASTKAAGANVLLSNTTTGYSGTGINDLLTVVAYN